MTVPRKTTFTYQLAERIYRNGGDMTIPKVFEIFSNISKNTLRSSIGRLVTALSLERDGDNLTMTADLRRHFAQEIASIEPGQIAERREYSVFGKTLSPTRMPSILGTRDGSNDYRNWPSRF
jgi:hypothetical protein